MAWQSSCYGFTMQFLFLFLFLVFLHGFVSKTELSAPPLVHICFLNHFFNHPYIAIIYFSESRYLLILTENYAALGLLEQELLEMENSVIIFGSSFRRDQEYTQVMYNKQ